MQSVQIVIMQDGSFGLAAPVRSLAGSRSALGRSRRPYLQPIANSPAVFPAVNASTTHYGLRPRPDQVSAGFSECRYFAAAGAREDFVSVPTSSARE